MSDWPADAEQVRVVAHETGSGPFLLTTRAWIAHDGAVSEFRCVHRFLTQQGRADYRREAERFGIFLNED